MMDNQEIDRIMDYTEDVATAIEALQTSDQFYLTWRDTDGGWHRMWHGHLVILLAVLKVCTDELSEDLRGGLAPSDND